ncbi:MAG: HEAT repeat domain-containing protein, partial [Candidatus Marinimicrobia bacterium]|nr:HEAT repeat domain-containing protein [Candidatus Neomarinimicrobiota bacterium]
MNKIQFLIFFIILLTGCSKNLFTSSERKILELQNNSRITSQTFQQFNQASPKVQKRLVLASANSRKPELLPSLIDLYSEATPLVRQSVAFALSQFDSQEARNFLITALKTESIPEVKEQLLLSLGKLGQEEGFSWILETFWDNGQKLVILRTIGYFFDRDITTPQAAKICIQSLTSDQHKVSFEAATTLTRFDDLETLQQNLPALQEAYQSSSVETRQKLLNILSKLNFDNKNKLFLKALDDSVDQIQIEAARHLSQMEPVQPVILKALQMNLRPLVLTTLLSNLPAKNGLVKQLESQLIKIAKSHSSRHGQGLAFQYLVGLKPLQNATIIPKNNHLIPYKIAGFYNSGKKAVLDSLFKYSLYSDPAISTPAYR